MQGKEDAPASRRACTQAQRNIKRVPDELKSLSQQTRIWCERMFQSNRCTRQSTRVSTQNSSASTHAARMYQSTSPVDKSGAAYTAMYRCAVCARVLKQTLRAQEHEYTVTHVLIHEQATRAQAHKPKAPSSAHSCNCNRTALTQARVCIRTRAMTNHVR